MITVPRGAGARRAGGIVGALWLGGCGADRPTTTSRATAPEATSEVALRTGDRDDVDRIDAELGDRLQGALADGGLAYQPITGEDAAPVDGPDGRAIDAGIKARAAEIRACYQHELARTADLAGKLLVVFTIAPDGTVSAAKIDRDRSSLDSEPVEVCILRQFRSLRFPASGGITVRYPLMFSSG